MVHIAHMDHMDHIDHMDHMDHIWVSGLVFGCLDLYLVSGLIFWVSTHHPVIYVRAADAFFFLKNDAPGSFEHVYCQFSRFSWI